MNQTNASNDKLEKRELFPWQRGKFFPNMKIYLAATSCKACRKKCSPAACWIWHVETVILPA